MNANLFPVFVIVICPFVDRREKSKSFGEAKSDVSTFSAFGVASLLGSIPISEVKVKLRREGRLHLRVSHLFGVSERLHHQGDGRGK